MLPRPFVRLSHGPRSADSSNSPSIGNDKKITPKHLPQVIVGAEAKWQRRCAVLTENVLAFSAFHGLQAFPEESCVTLESCK